jgi:hypothetical protein
LTKGPAALARIWSSAPAMPIGLPVNAALAASAEYALPRASTTLMSAVPRRPAYGRLASPLSRDTVRRLAWASPLTMRLNSCAITPCSSSRLSVCSAPRVSMSAGLSVCALTTSTFTPSSLSMR